MRLLASGLLFALLLLGGCRPAAPVSIIVQPSPSPAPRLKIVATFAPIYCFTKNVAGDLADVSMLVPPGADAAKYRPTPADLQALAQADVVVENGFGFERWLDALVPRGLKPGALRIVAGRGIQPLASGTAPADEMSLPVTNPYVWLDPLNAITEVQNIRDQLMLRDPVNADEYLRRENEYEAGLRDLDTDIGNALVGAKLDFHCFTPAFDWFFARYELHNDEAVDRATALIFPGAAVNGTDRARVILNPMCTGPASADFYETVSRANAAALQKALQQ